MKLLIKEGEAYYLVDLNETKPLSLREVLVASADDELGIINVADIRATDLDELLSEALNARLRPSTARAEAPKRTSTGTARSAGLGTGRTKEENDAVRVWAKAQGLDVKDGGRIANDVYTAYDNAHPKA